MSVKRFADQSSDKDYFSWLNLNPNGFVMNSMAKPSVFYINIHRATCPSIRQWEHSTSGYTHTTKTFGKVCALSEEELREWAKENLGSEAKPTRNCQQC